MKIRYLFILLLSAAGCRQLNEPACDLLGYSPVQIYYCKSDEGFSNTPAISKIEVQADRVDQFEEFPSQLKISFTDGDGNLNSNYNDTMCNPCNRPCFDQIPSALLLLTDKRTGCVTPYFFPLEHGLKTSITGDIYCRLGMACCIYADGRACEPREFFTDTLVYLVQIKDAAGNLSNVAETPPIFINCD